MAYLLGRLPRLLALAVVFASLSTGLVGCETTGGGFGSDGHAGHSH